MSADADMVGMSGYMQTQWLNCCRAVKSCQLQLTDGCHNICTCQPGGIKALVHGHTPGQMLLKYILAMTLIGYGGRLFKEWKDLRWQLVKIQT